MTKKIVSIILAGMLVFSSIAISGCKKSSYEESPVLTETQATETEENKIKNVILLIPDGGGYAPYDFANDVKVAGGLDEGKYPNKTETDTQPMTMRQYLRGSAITLNYNEELTDSAAAGTAIATGHKTINGYVGIDHALRPVANVLEAAQSVGKATGLVSTYEWMHATPASFSAHAVSRSDYQTLYEQIENQGIDVVLGSGYGAVSSYASIQNALDRGYTVIENREQLLAVKPGDKIWGDATNSSSPYDINLTETQPTLAQMTKAAITALSADEDGFFLMVEGSKVDTGGHSNDAVVTTSEYLAFDAAFKVAVDFAKSRTDTVVIATPDHDTGAMLYDEIINLDLVVTSVRQGRNPTSLGWGTTSHSTQNVGVWMYVPEGIDVVEGLSDKAGDTKETRENFVIQNTEIAPYVAKLFGVDLAELAEKLFVDVSKIGRYSSAVGKFTFNSGDKYLYKNQSVYYKNGEEISMNGMVAVEIDGKFYVPSVVVEENDWNFESEVSSAIVGTGTQEDPYIIDEAWDFVEFSANLILGETYEGVYFRQTKDIDLAGSSDFIGAGSKCVFAGIYDGGGHKINVDLEVQNDETVFPKLSGTIMNLGVTGKIKSAGAVNWAYTGGITRTVESGAKLVNCYSTVDIESLSAGGLTGANYGLVENCYFGGSLKATGKLSALSPITYNGVYNNCYYSDTCGAEQQLEGVTAVADEDIMIVVDSLEKARAQCAQTLGVSEDDMSIWRVSEETGKPELHIPEATIEAVSVTPNESVVNKGDGILLSAVVEGKYGPSQKVVWSIEGTEPVTDSVVYEDGYLKVGEEETASEFTVLAKSAVDGSVTGMCKITVGDDVVTERDGSRARPYLVSDEKEFLEFTNAVISGKNLSGLWFEQTADFDMTLVEGYNGMPSSVSFAGVYNGKGYKINLDIESAEDNCLFGSCSGVIMNVTTTGRVKNDTRSAGVCRALRGEGIVINCASSCEVIGEVEAAGIVRSNYNKVANCLFTGTLAGTSQYPTCYVQPGAAAYNNYAVGKDSYTVGGETVVTEEELSSDEMLTALNNSREKSGEFAGVSSKLLCEWQLSDDGIPELVK